MEKWRLSEVLTEDGRVVASLQTGQHDYKLLQKALRKEGGAAAWLRVLRDIMECVEGWHENLK